MLVLLREFEVMDRCFNGAYGFITMTTVVVACLFKFTVGHSKSFDGLMDFAMMMFFCGCLSGAEREESNSGTCCGERSASEGAFGHFHAD